MIPASSCSIFWGIFVERMQTISLSCADCTHKLDLRRVPPVHQACGTGHGMSAWLLALWSLLAESNIPQHPRAR